ncbi:hypothetical protein K3495_g5049 [Podosphaera aphanis]|nr:hypothetical protein K3495_g5049 [Podosphaera aphanis]
MSHPQKDSQTSETDPEKMFTKYHRGIQIYQHETSILPMEIYLKYRRVQHAGLTRNSPVQETIEKTCRKIGQVTSGGGNRGSLSKEKDRVKWARICSGEESIKKQKEMRKTAAFHEWANSWPQQTRDVTRRYRATAVPEVWSAAKFHINKNTGAQKMSLRGTLSKLHDNLTRAQSSIVVQIRSEHSGLKSYLFRRKVPGVDNPRYPCGYPSESVKHAVMACPLKANGRAEVWRKAKNRSFEVMMNNPEDLGRITQWILDQGWFEQFRLTGEVERRRPERGRRGRLT